MLDAFQMVKNMAKEDILTVQGTPMKETTIKI
jgi:hypothetical protein